MADTLASAPVKKEAAVLSEASLTCLAKELGPLALRVAMYLNVPTLTLIQLQNTATAKKWQEEELASQMLLAWRTQREGAKDKERVSDLERALRDNDKAEQADVVADKHKDNAELTADAFR